MKYLIVGLGNPGLKYDNTRHNIGFKSLDTLIAASNETFKTNKLGDLAEIKYKGRILILLKPSTYMNLSGKAVNYWMQKENIKPEKLLVITDDISLPLGQLRLKPKGRDGGHNGLKSIQEALGGSIYPRLRIGIGNSFSSGQQTQHVLGNWGIEESLVITNKITVVKDIVESFCTIGIERTMNTYNNK